MLHLLFTALIASTPAPSPSASPRTIEHETVYPICTVLHANLGQSIAAVIANDQAIEASKPLILNMARNTGSLGSATQNGLGNLHAPAQFDDESPGGALDTNRLERVIGTLEHNIEIVKQALKDPTRFPPNPQDSSDRQAVRLKGLLEDVLAQQEALLNLYEGLLDTRQTTTLASRGDPLQQLFSVDTPEIRSRGSLSPMQPASSNDTTYQNPKTQGGSVSLVTGPLSPLPAQIYNAEFSQTGLAGLENNFYGRFYAAVDLEQGRISYMESALAIRIIITNRECDGVPAVDRPRPY